MQVRKRNAHSSGSNHGLRNRIGNVVKFQVEKYIETLFHQCFNQCRTGGREQLLADLQAAILRADALCKLQCRRGVRVIQRNDDA